MHMHMCIHMWLCVNTCLRVLLLNMGVLHWECCMMYGKQFAVNMAINLIWFDLIWFGFQKGKSTFMALIVLLDKISAALENWDFVIGVFLDFSKAFDTVDHNILLGKLDFYGMKGVTYKWFEDYLWERKQYVTYNGITSDMEVIKCKGGFRGGRTGRAPPPLKVFQIRFLFYNIVQIRELKI